MADYSQMYLVLFRAVTEAIEILQKAQQEAEELYISYEPPDIVLLNSEDSINTTEN